MLVYEERPAVGRSEREAIHGYGIMTYFGQTVVEIIGLVIDARNGQVTASVDIAPFAFQLYACHPFIEIVRAVINAWNKFIAGRIDETKFSIPPYQGHAFAEVMGVVIFAYSSHCNYCLYFE